MDGGAVGVGTPGRTSARPSTTTLGRAELGRAERVIPPYGHWRFRGRFDMKIDKTGRVTIPSPLRHAFFPGEEICVVAPLGPSHLGLWTDLGYEVFVDAATRDETRTLIAPRSVREMDADARELAVDSQYRIVIPPELRSEVDLGDKLTVCGMTDRIEIWNSEARAAVRSDVDEIRADSNHRVPPQ